MAAATMAIYGSYGAGPTKANVEGGIKFNRADDFTTATTIPVPTTANTNYSWHKTIQLYCVTVGSPATTVSNKKIHQTGSPVTGILLFYKDVVDTYTQATSGNMIAQGAAGPATPATYSVIPGTATVYDSAGDAAATGTTCGDLIQIVIGVDNSYVGGPNNALALPSLVLTYDEAAT